MAEILVAQNSQLFNVLVALAKARGTAGPASKEEIQVFAEFTDRLLQISKDLEVIRAPLGVLRKQKGGG
jgi:hypothetical protein